MTPEKTPADNAWKVVFLFIGMPVGGAEDFALGVQPKMHPEVEAQFVCLRSLDVLGEEAVQKGLPVTLLPLFPSKRISPWGIWKFSRWLIEHGIDVVHSQTYHAHIYGVAAAWLAGIPAVVHQQKTLGQIPLRKKIFFGWCLKKATQILTLSEQTRVEISDHFNIPSSKIEVVPNAIDETLFCPPDDKAILRRNLGLPEKDFLVGTVASLHSVKNHKATIEALSILARKGCHPKVLFIGDGPARRELENLARERGVKDQILFAGRQRPVVPWMQALDLFLLPSHWEGQPLAMLQAISCGLPVIASAIEGNTAVLGTGHPGLFAPDDYTRLADILEAAGKNRDVLLSFRTKVSVPTCGNAAKQLKSIYRKIIP